MPIPGCSACQTLDCLDVLVKIFLQLKPEDVVNCGLTCKLWRRAALDVALWRHFCIQKWPSLSNPAAQQCLSVIRSFPTFFSQRASNAVDPDAASWLLYLHPTTLLIDVSLADRHLFSTALSGSSIVKERLRFKLPEVKNGAAPRSFQDLHVQLSIVRHTDGLSACLVNGFPNTRPKDSSSAKQKESSKGLKCVLLLIDNHAFLNFYW